LKVANSAAASATVASFPVAFQPLCLSPSCHATPPSPDPADTQVDLRVVKALSVGKPSILIPNLLQRISSTCLSHRHWRQIFATYSEIPVCHARDVFAMLIGQVSSLAMIARWSRARWLPAAGI
jgi:hypothetical protein